MQRKIEAIPGESIESKPEDFKLAVGRVLGKALDSLQEDFKNQPKERDNLPFHNSEHTEGVIRRIEMILSAVKEADSTLLTDHDIDIGKLAGAGHDLVQRWEENKIADGEFVKVIRKRFAGRNEEESSDKLIIMLQEENENVQLFTDDDKATIQRAIHTTVPGWDMENKTVMQPNLTDGNSLVERAVALSDLATAGMDGPKKFANEGKALFREENLDILEAVRNQDENPLSDKQKEYFKKRMVEWLKSQAGFAKGRQARLKSEIQAIPESAREAVEKLFDKFDDSIVYAEKIAELTGNMDFEELIKYMGY